MSIEYYFFDAKKTGETYDRTYSAGDFARYLNKLVGNGVFPNPSDCLQVYAGTGMQVLVKPGEGWIEGHKLVNDADVPLTIDAADVTLNRIDRVVFFLDMVNREMGIRVKKGSNSSSPEAPAVTRTQDLIEYSLGTVTVNKQTSSISQSMIRDTRLDSSVCGVVQGLVQQASTDTLFIQWVSAFETQHDSMQESFDSQYTANQEAFDEWFSEVKSKVASIAPVKEYHQTYVTTDTNTGTIPIQIPEYLYETDIMHVYVNGMKLPADKYETSQTILTLKDVLDVSGTVVELVVIKSTTAAE